MSRAPRATLFKHDDFEFSTQIVLGPAYYRAADVGEVLATIDSIKDGDYGSWCEQWRATAERVEAIGKEAAESGHSLSARDAYLRASSYWWQAASYILGAEQGSADELRALWRRHRDCFERAAEHTAGAWEKVAIPYEATSLEGWFFHGAPTGEPAPLLILNNGSDGTVTDMGIQGGAPGTERG
jgi:hypothetical protein